VAATTSSLHSGGRNSPRAPATDDTEAPTDSKIYCRLVDYRLLANGCMLNGSGGTDLLSRFNDVVFRAVSYAFFSMTVGRKAYTQCAHQTTRCGGMWIGSLSSSFRWQPAASRQQSAVFFFIPNNSSEFLISSVCRFAWNRPSEWIVNSLYTMQNTRRASSHNFSP